MYFSAIGIALLAACIYGFLGICFQIAGERRMNILNFLFYKQLLGFIFGIVLSLYLGLTLFQPRMFFLGAVAAASYLITSVAYLKATREREIAASWTVLNLSVALPITSSVLWFGDPFTSVKAVGVILTLLSILFIGGGLTAASWKNVNTVWLKWILVAFLFNGWMAVLFRFVPGREGPLFTTYFYGLSFVLIGILYLFKRQFPPLDKALFWVSAGGAVTHWSGIVLTIFALNLMARVSSSPGVVIYPITNGLVIPVGVILGIILLKERPSMNTTTGVMLGMAALVLFFL